MIFIRFTNNKRLQYNAGFGIKSNALTSSM